MLLLFLAKHHSSQTGQKSSCVYFKFDLGKITPRKIDSWQLPGNLLKLINFHLKEFQVDPGSLSNHHWKTAKFHRFPQQELKAQRVFQVISEAQREDQITRAKVAGWVELAEG